MISRFYSTEICTSPQVSWTVPNIVADLKNAVVCMFPTCLLIFKSSSPFTKYLDIVLSTAITVDIFVTFIFFSFLLAFWQDLGTYVTFCFLLFSLHGPPRTAQCTICQVFFVSEVCLNLKIPENLVRFFFQDGF